MRRVLMTAMCAALCLACPVAASAQQRFKARVLSGTASDNVQAPPDVTMTAPSEDAVDRSINLTLNYAVSGGDCTLATLYLDDVNGQTVFDTDAECSGVFSPGPLEYETIYHWRVKVENEGGSTIGAVRAFTTAALGARSLLSYSDLDCSKKWAGINVDGGGIYSIGWPVTPRTVGTDADHTGPHRHWFQFKGNNHVIEYPEPSSGSACNTAIGSLAMVASGRPLSRHALDQLPALGGQHLDAVDGGWRGRDGLGHRSGERV